jgi:hypothetical protein
VVTDTLCVDCYEYLHVQLVELPALWGRAQIMLPKINGAAGERVSTSGMGSSPPLRVGIFDVVQHSAGMVESWVHTLRIRSGDASRVDPGVLAGSRYLDVARLDLIGSPLLIAFYNDMFGIHRSLVRVAGSDPEVLRLTEPCPTCSNVALVKKRNDDYVRCLTCSAQWGQAAYLGLLRRASLPRPVHRYVPQKGELQP